MENASPTPENPQTFTTGETHATMQEPARRLAVTISPHTLWLGAAIIALFVGIAVVLLNALDALILFFIAIIFAEGLRPLVAWMHQHRVPRPLGVLLVYVLILLVIAVLVWLLVEPLVAQFGSFAAAVPRYMEQAQSFMSSVQRQIGGNPQFSRILTGIESQAGTLVSDIVPLLLDVPLLIGRLLVGAVVIIVMAFFWLTGVDRLKPFVISLFPERVQAQTSETLGEIGGKLGGYVRGVVFNMFVIGILSGFGNFLLGVPFPLLLGIFAGLMEVIPYVGPWISGAAAVLVALVMVGPIKGLEVVALYVLIQEIEGHTLLPVVMNRAVELNPLTVLIAVLLGASLLGIVGGVLAVPVAAIIKVLVVRVVAPATRQASERVSTRDEHTEPQATEATTQAT